MYLDDDAQDKLLCWHLGDVDFDLYLSFLSKLFAMVWSENNLYIEWQ